MMIKQYQILLTEYKELQHTLLVLNKCNFKPFKQNIGSPERQLWQRRHCSSKKIAVQQAEKRHFCDND
jgi:hypothetical protein